jgi:predicted MFS family arabinose efflux permease
MSAVGVAGCFFANGLSFVAIVLALLGVHLPKNADGDGVPAHSVRDRRALWQDFLEGFKYVRGRPRVRFILLCSAVTSLCGAPYLVLIPIFARDVYHWGETGLSIMMGIAGAGAFCGALLLMYLGDFRRKGLFILVSSFAAGLSLIGFALVAQPSIALVLLFVVGFAMVCFFASTNTLLQQLVTDQMRGRVMSIWILTFIGTMPIGSFLAGLVAQHYGAPRALAAGGILIVIFILVVGLRNQLAVKAD